MTEISQLGQLNQRYVAQKVPCTEPQVPTAKNYLLNQPIKDEVSFGNTQASAPEEKSGGALKWVLGLGILGVGAFLLHKHIKGKDVKAVVKELTPDEARLSKNIDERVKTEQVTKAVKNEVAVSYAKDVDIRAAELADESRHAKLQAEYDEMAKQLDGGTVQKSKIEPTKAEAPTAEVAKKMSSSRKLPPPLPPEVKTTANPEKMNDAAGYTWQTKTSSPVTAEVVPDKQGLFARLKGLFSGRPKNAEPKSVQPKNIEPKNIKPNNVETKNSESPVALGFQHIYTGKADTGAQRVALDASKKASSSADGYQWQTKTTSPVTVEVVTEKQGLLGKVKTFFSSKQKQAKVSTTTVGAEQELKAPVRKEASGKNHAFVRGKNSLADDEQFLASTTKGVPWSPYSKVDDKTSSGITWSPWGKKK